MKRAGSSPTSSHYSVTCNQFRRLLTPAVDGRLSGVQRRAFERHAHDCPPCREQYELEAAVKLAVRRHVPRIQAPQALRDLIITQIRGETSGAQGRSTLGSRVRALLRVPFLMPAAIIMLASALILVVAALHRQGAGDGDSSLVAHLLETHRALESGELLPDMGSADAERVQRYLSRQTNLAVTVPSLAGFALTGGFTVLYGGSHAAHLVYRRDNTVLSIVQMSLEDILHGRGLLLPMNIRKELMHTGWYADSRENGMTLLFWTRGTMLCAAVGPVGRAELQGELSRSEGNAPTETPW